MTNLQWYSTLNHSVRRKLEYVDRVVSFCPGSRYVNTDKVLTTMFLIMSDTWYVLFRVEYDVIWELTNWKFSLSVKLTACAEESLRYWK